MALHTTAGELTAAVPSVEMGTTNCAQVGVEVSGTWTGTITFESRIGLTWENAQVFTIAGVSAAATTTANVRRRIDTGSTNAVRARWSTPTSGAPYIQFSGTEAGMGGSGGGGGGGGAATIADGADVAQGSTTDAGIITDSNGTVIGFLRGAVIQWITQLSRMGSVTETAPATDTASSGLNGRLQRIAQRLTSLIALFPSALVGGRLDTNIGAIPGTVSSANSSTATLGGGAVFTGTGEDVSNYASIFVSAFADQASAASGLSVQFSPDNTNWDHTRAITVSASSGMILSVSPAAKFFRVVYTNGATPNTVFRLQTIYRPVEVTRSISVFADVNGTQSTAAMGQRIFSDIMVQDAVGNATNRIRSARDLAAAGGVAGGTHLGMGMGRLAVAHGSSPSAITAGNYGASLSNRHGIGFTIGGHPNIITRRDTFSTAQTDTKLVTVSAGTKIVVTRIAFSCDKANTLNILARAGFAATNTPTGAGVLISHPGIDPGGGISQGNGAGMLGVGADGDDLILTTVNAGNIDVVTSYFTIDS